MSHHPSSRAAVPLGHGPGQRVFPSCHSSYILTFPPSLDPPKSLPEQRALTWSLQ